MLLASSYFLKFVGCIWMALKSGFLLLLPCWKLSNMPFSFGSFQTFKKGALGENNSGGLDLAKAATFRLGVSAWPRVLEERLVAAILVNCVKTKSEKPGCRWEGFRV